MKLLQRRSRAHQGCIQRCNRWHQSLQGPLPPPVLRQRQGRRCADCNRTLVRIAALYEIEEAIRGHSPDKRRTVRQLRSKQLVDSLEAWIKEQLERVSKGSPVAEALRYGMNHWDGLTRFLDDGRIEIDSTTVERYMRPIALVLSSDDRASTQKTLPTAG
jgi:hypothetical protein